MVEMSEKNANKYVWMVKEIGPMQLPIVSKKMNTLKTS